MFLLKKIHNQLLYLFSASAVKLQIHSSTLIFTAMQHLLFIQLLSGMRLMSICDRLRINRPLAANIEFTLREFKVQ